MLKLKSLASPCFLSILTVGTTIGFIQYHSTQLIN